MLRRSSVCCAGGPAGGAPRPAPHSAPHHLIPLVGVAWLWLLCRALVWLLLRHHFSTPTTYLLYHFTDVDHDHDHDQCSFSFFTYVKYVYDTDYNYNRSTYKLNRSVKINISSRELNSFTFWVRSVFMITLYRSYL